MSAPGCDLAGRVTKIPAAMAIIRTNSAKDIDEGHKSFPVHVLDPDGWSKAKACTRFRRSGRRRKRHRLRHSAAFADGATTNGSGSF
jgi:hypothetical protein